jgi:hypothetical protein
MTRDYATLFQNTMDELWGNYGTEVRVDFIVKALVTAVRGTARINPENALEVLDLWGPDLIASVDARADNDEPDTALFTVKFIDYSSLLIIAKRGIGSGIESL